MLQVNALGKNILISIGSKDVPTSNSENNQSAKPEKVYGKEGYTYEELQNILRKKP